MVLKNKKPLNLAIQALGLRNAFPNAEIRYTQNELVWESTLVPTPLSDSYLIRLVYIRNEEPNIYVIDPKLPLAEGAKKLPHTYKEQHLCLYYRRAREWRDDMYLYQTVIPWTSEWLQFYEIWLGTGKWNGGGIEH